MHAYTHTHTNTHTHTHTHTYIHTYTHTHTQRDIHTYIHIYRVEEPDFGLGVLREDPVEEAEGAAVGRIVQVLVVNARDQEGPVGGVHLDREDLVWHAVVALALVRLSH